jgi:biopolymer transport protein ExbB
MESFGDMISGGGPIVVVLIVLSLISVALIVVKGVQLAGATGGAARREAAFALWSGGDRTAAIEAIGEPRTPVDRLVKQAMTGLLAGLNRKALDDDLEWRGNAEVAAMGRHIRILELIAMISPLLGLLGTVLGMIRSFQELALAEGAANASLLAAGIWQALLTTAAGLIVAIPAAIAASLLSARVDAAGQTIEAAIGRLYAIEDRVA